MDTCSCMILNYNDAKTVKKLLTEIVNYPVFVHILGVDTCSTDGSFAGCNLHFEGLLDIVID